MPTISEIAGLLGQYLRDASPGGELNREVQPQVVGDVARGGLLGLTADTLGTPVDLAAMAMRPLGYSHPKPVGGSDWLAERMTKPTGSGAETAARTVTGLLTPSPADVAHLVPGLLGATVWHGSPHKFDKFDISKIGTGEGAQAYGHGLYLADSPAVAKSYMEAGGPGKMLTVTFKDGKQLYNSDLTDNHLKAITALERGAKDAGKFPHNTAYYAKKTTDDPKVLELIDSMKDAKIGYQSHASMYKVDLPDEHIAKMLDWDKPLSQQPESVRKSVRKAFGKTYGERGQANFDAAIDKTGGEIIQTLSGRGPKSGEMAARTSDNFKKSGVPGIKYFDGGSRTAGEGTRNYVVFDDSLLKILERQ